MADVAHTDARERAARARAAPAETASQSSTPTRARRPGRKLSIRAVIGITLIAVWALATLTGVLLYVAPEGRRSGQQDILFGLTKGTWGEIHWWISLAAVIVTIVHLAVDWKTFRSCVRHLTHTHGATPTTWP